MGDVWLARASGPAGFEKLVVLKTIRPSQQGDADATEMFLREGTLAAMLSHPNCVQVFELGEEDGTYFIAMEYIDGLSLSRVLRRARERGRPVPIGIAVRIAMDACSGLDYAHALKDRSGTPLGLIHRDISPDNLLVSFTGATKLVDFGIAKAASGLIGEKTSTGVIKGKPGYMAPEYLRGEAFDLRVDLFALGIVLYYALVGARPFTGDNEAQIVTSVLGYREPPSARAARDDIPPALDDVLRKVLASEPGKRHATARELRSALAAAMPNVADGDAVATYLAEAWPEDDPDRQAVRQLMAGEARDSSPALPPLRSVTRPEAPTRALVTSREGATAGATTTVAGSAAPARRRWPIAVGGLAAVALAAVAMVAWPRGGEAPAPLPAPKPVAAALAKPAPKLVTILVADVANTTGQANFDGTLEPLFGIALEGARFIALTGRGEAKRLAKQLAPPRERLDDATARQVAIGERLDAVITSEIRRTGDRFTLAVTASEASSGVVIATSQLEVAGEREVLRAIPKLIAPIRRALGDPTPEDEQTEGAGGAFTAASLDAAHEFSVGMDMQSAGRFDEALVHCGKAAELDPGFARAYLCLSASAVDLDRREDAERYSKLSLEHVDRMTELERHRSRMEYFFTIRDWRHCIDEGRDMVSRYTVDANAWTNLAGCYVGEHAFKEAVDAARRAVELRPKAILQRVVLAFDCTYASDFACGETALRAASTASLNACSPT
jgi:serine/threonine-protein kinase